MPDPIRSSPSDESSGFASAVRTGLRTPLDALRVSLESLSREVAAGTGTSDRLSGALDEVQRLSRNVRALAEWAEPRPLHPMRCTPHEIALAALTGLDAPARARVRMASEAGAPAALSVDAPVVSRCLRQLVDNALAGSGGPVLVRVGVEPRRTTFSVVDAGRGPGDVQGALRPFTTTRPGSLGLGLALVDREIRRMNGSFRLTRTPRGHTLAAIHLGHGPPA